MNKQHLITELQSQGLQLLEPNIGASGRKGGAGPSDHKAVTIDGTTVMVPIFTGAAAQSPYSAEIQPAGEVFIKHSESILAPVHFPQQPQFYCLTTADGIPYWKIALLHSRDVLATTVMQTCIRYGDTRTSCQFCAIGQSLQNDRTIARKTPEQLAEVSEAAVRLDGVKHLVMTTGTPNGSDRGAAYLSDCAAAQCEPPDNFAWFERMRQAGVDSLGMHLEAVEPKVRERIMPGKATVPVSYYFEAFTAAVKVFGRGQVSTYLLAGLGDSLETLVATSDRLIQLGVYPFIVPFVPITGTPLAEHPAPNSQWMYELYQQVGQLLQGAGLSSQDMKAGCAKCGACSALSTFEA
jgi:radical SAM protein (TIGR04043 family)